MPHALVLASLIKQHKMTMPQAARLLNRAGLYLDDRARYGEAEPLLGAEHPSTALSLNNLAGLYRAQGKYGSVEPLYERALSIVEKMLGQSHPSTQTVRANYASLLQVMKHNRAAKPEEEGC